MPATGAPDSDCFSPPRPRTAVTVLAIVAVAALATCCGSGQARSRPSPTPTAALASSPLGPNLITLTFRGASGAQAMLHVRVDATQADRARGLMNVARLPDDEGDLFVFDDVSPNQDVTQPFWMKDTLIPLSIAFVSADGHVLEVQTMEAETETIHFPHQPYRFAIEANLGWYVNHGLGPGATVDLPAALHNGQGR